MIETGLKKLDQFLGGGIKDGLVTSISGQNATGKTQLAFQICLGALHNGKEILFQDTTGEFRPERLVEMISFSPTLKEPFRPNSLRIRCRAQLLRRHSRYRPRRLPCT